MPFRHREGREPRGRICSGRRRHKPGSIFFSEVRAFVKKLLEDGLSPEQIIEYVLTEEFPFLPEPELKVLAVDLQVETNTKQHRTHDFDIVDEACDPHLVLRRGQPFNIHVCFSKAFSSKTNDLRLVFEIGDAPIESKGTRACFLLFGKDQEGMWSAKATKTSKESVDFSVITPPDCIVGKWNFRLEIVENGVSEPISRFEFEKPVYILFNPWCKEDVVYYAKQEDLNEYVLHDSGCIYVGSFWSSGARDWKFGQFEEKVLDCCMYLLDSSDLNLQVRGDPIKVVRKLSAMINACDEGMLIGNWSGDYDGGTSPLEWAGSAAILEKYYNTKEPVRYGQCWVFSGVFTTVCRALGIPCRSVTNFDSAHDTDCSVTIDKHFDKNMEELEYRNSDSIWNFHVWNEAWMRRDDLPDGYGGWQACDATPQECSEGLYQCGPCPLRAIKEGELNMSYDVPFVFAEVNADEVYWMQDETDGSFKAVEHHKRAVGKYMSTRALDSTSKKHKREVVTSLYKYPEGSKEERAAVLKAYGQTGSKRQAYDIGPQDVEFKLDFNKDTPVGQDFMVKLLCKNSSNENRTIHGRGTISTMYYTGIVAEKVAVKKFRDFKLAPSATKSLELKVVPDSYMGLLKDDCFLSFTMTAYVDETKQSAIKTDKIMLLKPSLTIEAPQQVKYKSVFEVVVNFNNPLPAKLTGCKVNVDCPGMYSVEELQDEVAPQGMFKIILKLKLKKKGKQNVVFVCGSKELSNITGNLEVQVQV